MATIEEIEERVARLERIEEDRRLDAALRAQAYGINLIHGELAEARANLAGLDAKVDANHVEINGKLDAIIARLDRV